ncbi:hypothetical protein [Natrinema gelatinilyticum]|uniref:hypothetical protein n=1 Tax=Natrinema gelatinilyticum TaxID=2961571 RepID=UPI0020C5140C|nr:hypothetical protein [Natrinema gelatinilyticum]
MTGNDSARNTGRRIGQRPEEAVTATRHCGSDRDRALTRPTEVDPGVTDRIADLAAAELGLLEDEQRSKTRASGPRGRIYHAGRGVSTTGQVTISRPTLGGISIPPMRWSEIR